jgi:hypothetical protein
MIATPDVLRLDYGVRARTLVDPVPLGRRPRRG